MGSETTLVPLSKEELTKLAEFAIEAKQKAYCKSLNTVLTALLRNSCNERKSGHV